MEKVINWQALSLVVTGKKDTLRPNRIPKKYKTKVDKLFFILNLWQNDIDFIETQKIAKQKQELLNEMNAINSKMQVLSNNLTNNFI